jgi:hypothetical protein
MAASKEALQLKAAMMFNRSVELQTGGIQWTRGELLGRWDMDNRVDNLYTAMVRGAARCFTRIS